MIQLPNDQQSEKAIIGCLLIDPQQLHKLELPSADIYNHAHRMVYEEMRGLYNRNQSVDIITVSGALKSSGHLGEIGGDSFLTECTAMDISPYHLPAYVEIVRAHARRRRTITEATELVKAAYDLDGNLDAAISQAVTNLVSVTSSRAGAISISEYAKEIYTFVEERYQSPTEIYGMATGLVDVDEIMAGARPGHQVILSGAPGIGKTLLAMQLCERFATGDISVPPQPGVVYELDVDEHTLMIRMVSASSKIPTKKLNTGRMEADDWQDFTEQIGRISNLPIFISGRTDWNTVSLRADLSRLKASHNIGWFMLDYMNKLTDTIPGAKRFEVENVISSSLHNMCRELNIFGLTLQSVNKQNEVSGSNQMQHDSDQIIKMTHEDNDLENVITLDWVKHRHNESNKSQCKLVRIHGLPAFVNYKGVKK